MMKEFFARFLRASYLAKHGSDWSRLVRLRLNTVNRCGQAENGNCGAHDFLHAMHAEEIPAKLRDGRTKSLSYWCTPGRRQNAPETSIRYTPESDKVLYELSQKEEPLDFLEHADKLWSSNPLKGWKGAA